MSLNEDLITFGKYKDLTIKELLRDRSYCKWLLKNDWFEKQYEYLFNRVKKHLSENIFSIQIKPFDPSQTIKEFIDSYTYFHLTNIENIFLNEKDKKCYEFYLYIIDNLKNQIGNDFVNPYNIKTPQSWLNEFEKKCDLSRDIFKEFLNAYELPNITSIVEDIKKMGGIDYKGAKSFKIAKENSLKQEAFWEQILKKYYGEEITVQHKFENCIFDFVRLFSKTDKNVKILYECKLGLKDFNLEQYRKYNLALENSYDIIYLISTDCIIDLKCKKIFTTNRDIYEIYFLKTKKLTKLDEIIKNFEIVNLTNIEDYFKESKNL